MVVRTLALTFVAMLCLSSQGYAQCATPEYAKAMTLRVSPQAVMTDDIRGQRGAEFIEAFNRQPPKSSLEADRVLVFRLPPFPARVLFFKDNCLQAWADVSSQTLSIIMGEIGA